MSREYVVHGESLVSVKGTIFDDLSELGLAEDEIVVTERLYHEDIMVDDFGPNVAVDVLTNMSDVLVRMVMIHYDTTILDYCIAASQASFTNGVMGYCGTPLFAGGFAIRLNIKCTDERPYRFFQAYLIDNVPIPISTKRSAVELTWRCLPVSPAVFVQLRGYTTEIVSPNSLIYDRVHDDFDNLE